MNIHRVFKILVGVILAGSVGFLALLAYAAWMIEPERTACASVGAGGLAMISQEAPPAPWAGAVAAPGVMMDAPDLTARYRYFEPGNASVAAIFFDGQSREVSPQSFAAFCATQHASERDCRFAEDAQAFGYVRFERGHTLESETDYVASELRKVQADGATVEVFVTSRGTHEIEVAECDLARALWYLSGRD